MRRAGAPILAAAMAAAAACATPTTGARCGDGVVNPASEECDDGNEIPGDGCSPACALENPGTCGDGICDLAVESCAACALDCATAPACAACGDGACDLGGGESCLGCPADCDPDPACGPPPPVCGDGLCDPAVGEDCTSCPADCEVDAGCVPPPPPPACGNGMLDAAETCDGAFLAGADCLGLGFAGGVLACNATCDAYDTSGCVPATGPSVPTVAGELVITEIMRNPAGVADVDGEWLEVHNPGAADLEMMGLTVLDDGTDSFVVGTSLVVPAGGYVVLGRNADTAANGGVTLDHVFTGMSLGNTGDEVEIRNGATTIDRVAYTNATFPTTAGAAMSLGAASTTAVANDSGANWCPATAPYGTSGELGTPGAANPACP